MEGRRVRFSLLISVSIIFLMAHNARSQSSTSAEKSAAGKSTVPPKSAMKKLLPAANAWVETTLGKITVLEARAVGVHWIYAPDADVNNNPGNPIINTRSFGENPERVAQFVSEFVRGVRENGGLATAKHFPGHGDTAADSHIDLPVIRADRARLDSLELIPFRAAISAQVDSIMTGHLNVPALEPDPNTPATLSHNILTEVLRKQLGYQGLIVTDAMDMGGIN